MLKLYHVLAKWFEACTEAVTPDEMSTYSCTMFTVPFYNTFDRHKVMEKKGYIRNENLRALLIVFSVLSLPELI